MDLLSGVITSHNQTVVSEQSQSSIVLLAMGEVGTDPQQPMSSTGNCEKMENSGMYVNFYSMEVYLISIIQMTVMKVQLTQS